MLINSAWLNVSKAASLKTSHPARAWEEVEFSYWALYESTLFIKLMPLQFTGKYAKSWKQELRLIWRNGHIILNDTVFRIPTPPPGSNRSFFKPLLFQTTWTNTPQHPGPWVLERMGSKDNCRWWWYHRLVQEYLIFHFDYVHKFKVLNSLELKSIQTKFKKGCILWQYKPFDLLEVPCQ
jgi:hypothetical protein